MPYAFGSLSWQLLAKFLSLVFFRGALLSLLGWVARDKDWRTRGPAFMPRHFRSIMNMRILSSSRLAQQAALLEAPAPDLHLRGVRARHERAQVLPRHRRRVHGMPRCPGSRAKPLQVATATIWSTNLSNIRPEHSSNRSFSYWYCLKANE